jgi:hypothetical protein
VGTIAIIVGLTIITTLGASLIRPLIPYLFTSYLPSWSLFFHFDIDMTKLLQAIIVNLVYIILFLGTTIVYFNKKDILT